MCLIGDVFLLDVSETIPNRETKHCVCISISHDRYITINTESRIMYDDFKIDSKDYIFLNGTDRYIACSQTFNIKPENRIRQVGVIRFAEMNIIIEKIQNSKTLLKKEKDLILPDLQEWLLDNS